MQYTDGITKFGQQNCEYFISDKDYQEELYQTKGRIYINNLESYVDYDTSYDMSVTPFVFNYSGVVSGEGRYIMANGANLKVFHDRVEIDADNDGTYELAN